MPPIPARGNDVTGERISATFEIRATAERMPAGAAETGVAADA